MRLPLLPLLFLFAHHGLAQAQTTDELIRAVESGLGPPVALAGQPVSGLDLRAQMAKYQVPAVSVAVIRNGKIAWARGYGRQSENGAPVDSRTLFQAASLSKSLTGMAALRLVQDGVLSLDAPVGTALKSWSLPGNRFTAQQAVTLRGLLSHTAGVTGHGFYGYAAGAVVPSLVQVLDGAAPANSPPVVVDAVPGSRFRYSGGGYTIAQQMMLDATGKTYPALMKTLVLDPIGMRHSTFEQPLPPALRARVALPVDADGKPVEGGPHVYPEMAAAGLWTTPSDLALWVIEVQRSLRHASNRVLDAAMARQLLAPVLDGYALGVDTSRTGGRAALTHGGGNVGYRARYFAYENGDGAVIMTNGENGDRVLRQLMRSIANAYGWADFRTIERRAVTLAPAQQLPYAGVFEVKELGRIEIRLRNGGLEVRTDEPFLPLLAAGPGNFFTVEHAKPLEIRFDSAHRGSVSYSGESFAFSRVAAE